MTSVTFHYQGTFYERQARLHAHEVVAPPIAWAWSLEEPSRGYLSCLVVKYTIMYPTAERSCWTLSPEEKDLKEQLSRLGPAFSGQAWGAPSSAITPHWGSLVAEI